MEGIVRTWFTPKQKAELWERWKSGQCVADIARALERRNKSGVYRVLAVNGGIAPPPRRRAPLSLSLAEREENCKMPVLITADAFRFQPLFSKRLILITMLFGCSNASFAIAA